MRSAIATALSLLIALSGCGGALTPLEPDVPQPWPDRWDSEFLYWCMPEGDGYWDVYGDAPDPEDCPNHLISRGNWEPERLPLRVSVVEDWMQDAAVLAAESINLQTGIHFFEVAADVDDPDVVIVQGGDMGSTIASAHHMTIDGVHYGAVFMYLRYSPDVHLGTMEHELGHILGLKHDNDQPYSLMCQLGAGRQALAGLEQQDIDALRALYLGI